MGFSGERKYAARDPQLYRKTNNEEINSVFLSERKDKLECVAPMMRMDSLIINGKKFGMADTNKSSWVSGPAVTAIGGALAAAAGVKWPIFHKYAGLWFCVYFALAAAGIWLWKKTLGEKYQPSGQKNSG
jgi:hypothetical protein